MTWAEMTWAEMTWAEMTWAERANGVVPANFSRNHAVVKSHNRWSYRRAPLDAVALIPGAAELCLPSCGARAIVIAGFAPTHLAGSALQFTIGPHT